MAIRSELDRLKKEVGEVSPAKETVLPVFVLPDDTTFTLRWGFWGGKYPRLTRTETHPIEELEATMERLGEEGSLSISGPPVFRVVLVPNDDGEGGAAFEDKAEAVDYLNSKSDST